MSNTPAAPTQTLLRTPLYESHIALGAKMVPFAGWEMPVSYPLGTLSEVKACRSSVGLFDVCHMSEIVVTGSQALDLVNFATTNDIKRITRFEAQYSLLLNDSGGVIDDVIVYCMSPQDFTFVVNASRHDEDLKCLKTFESKFDAKVYDISGAKGLIAVQGPNAVQLVTKLVKEVRIPSDRFRVTVTNEIAYETIICRTGYTGEDGVELLCEADGAPELWNELIELGGVPCGLGARDILRLEAGYPLYGHELDEEHSPFESGVGWVVKLDKGNFAGRDALLEKKAQGIGSKLVGLKAISPANSIPRQGCSIEARDGTLIGEVTSGTLSPILGAGIALTRIKAEHAKLGAEVVIDIRGRKVTAQVVKTPFVKTSLSGAGG